MRIEYAYQGVYCFFIALLGGALGAWLSFSDEKLNEGSRRLDYDCSAVVMGVEACKLWIPRLAAVIDSLDGKIIDVSGYLAINSKSQLVLCAGEIEYIRQIPGSCLVVTMNRFLNDQDKAFLYDYVRVVGEYRADFRSGELGMPLGRVIPISRFISLEEIPEEVKSYDITVEVDLLNPEWGK